MCLITAICLRHAQCIEKRKIYILKGRTDFLLKILCENRLKGKEEKKSGVKKNPAKYLASKLMDWRESSGGLRGW